MTVYKLALREYVRRPTLVRVFRQRILLESTKLTEVPTAEGKAALGMQDRFFVVCEDDGKAEPKVEKKVVAAKPVAVKETKKSVAPKPVTTTTDRPSIAQGMTVK